jgi:hypothetical protein
VIQPLMTCGCQAEAKVIVELSHAGMKKSCVTFFSFWFIKTFPELINKFMKSERTQSLSVK